MWYVGKREFSKIHDLQYSDRLDKVEQLSWLATLLYGVGGWTKDGFLPDFYM